MAQVKRAKWIEGITQSKRILRDIAEIVTTANRNEEGIAKAENWELVYPRPFEEFPITRGRLIRDEAAPRQFLPVIENTERIVLSGTTPTVLKEPTIVESTVIVQNEDLSITYVLDTDYTYDIATNTIARLDTGAIPSDTEVVVSYGTTVNQILESIDVKVEKVLTIAEPYRVIDPADYTLDSANKKLTILNTAHLADAAYFALTFTEITGPYSREEEEKMQLIPDPLDPTGTTFLLPSGTGAIGLYPTDKRTVASAPTGRTGVGAGGIQYELDEVNHRVEFISGAPVIDDTKQKILFSVYHASDSTNTVWNLEEFILTPDAADPTGATYIVVGAINRLNEGRPHSVIIETTTTQPVVHKHLSSLHAGFEELEAEKFIVDFENPKVTVLEDVPEELRATFTARGVDDLAVGFAKIKNRVVLKTTTEPEQYFAPVIGTDYGAVDTSESLTMYVELDKPEKLVNPETGLTRYVDHLGMQNETQKNNHYIQMRMFDRWDDGKQVAQDATYDDANNLIEKGAYISDWVKYAWFKDWKEYMVDELDDDPGSANVQDGILFKEVMTQGMTEEFPVQFWISTNNNRIALVLMGDPTLDQDNFLTSFAYLGRIHPFYNKECVVKKDEAGTIVLDATGNPVLEEKRTYFQNDVSGNFAMTAGSSTLPSAIGAPPKGRPTIDAVEIATDDTGSTVIGDLYDYSVFSYAVTYLTEVGESMPSTLDSGRITVGKVDAGSLNPTSPEIGLALKIRFRLPEEATGYRIYRFHDAGRTAFGPEVNVHTNYRLVTSNTKLDRSRTIEYVDDGVILPMHEAVYNSVSDSYTYHLLNTSWDPYYARFITAVPSARSFEAVTRDTFTGAIIDVKFSTKYGRDTATGVNDVMMYQTRSGLKYQRHNAAFISTEEFMRKEKSGQSRWTGKFHLSPVYVEHSYDKQRGWLDGVMAVDDSGIEHLDELIVDKDTPTEEVYKFFRINAPYSFFNNSPNYSFGLAIIKSSLRWD